MPFLYPGRSDTFSLSAISKFSIILSRNPLQSLRLRMHGIFDRTFYIFRKMFICFDTKFFDYICRSALLLLHAFWSSLLSGDIHREGLSLLHFRTGIPFDTGSSFLHSEYLISAVRVVRILEAVTEIPYQFTPALSSSSAYL